MRTSKDVFKTLENFMDEFKISGQEWVENDDVDAVHRARGFSKKLIKNLREFVELAVREEDALPKKEEPAEELMSNPVEETDEDFPMMEEE